MSITVEPNHPLAELLARKLLGIEGVPAKEQTRMVARAIREATKWAKQLQDENEQQRIEIEFIKAQLSKYLSEPETFTTDTASHERING